MTKELPSPELLRKVLRYEPETGELFWLPRPRENFTSEKEFCRWNSRYADQIAGYDDGRGYVKITIKPLKIRAHRVAWAMHYGKWPKGEIDHINGDRGDNRIENLRDVSKSKNQRNAAKKSHNTSGHNGVSLHKQSGKWQAGISINGHRFYIGLFEDIDAAVAARKAAEAGHGFTERHGQ